MGYGQLLNHLDNRRYAANDECLTFRCFLLISLLVDDLSLDLPFVLLASIFPCYCLDYLRTAIIPFLRKSHIPYYLEEFPRDYYPYRHSETSLKASATVPQIFLFRMNSNLNFIQGPNNDKVSNLTHCPWSIGVRFSGASTIVASYELVSPTKEFQEAISSSGTSQ